MILDEIIFRVVIMYFTINDVDVEFILPRNVDSRYHSLRTNQGQTFVWCLACLSRLFAHRTQFRINIVLKWNWKLGNTLRESKRQRLLSL